MVYMPRTKKTVINTPNKTISKVEQLDKAFALRLQGYSYDEIAKVIGASVAYTQSIIEEKILTSLSDKIISTLMLDLQRIDDNIKLANTQKKKSPLQSINSINECIKLRSNILGIQSSAKNGNTALQDSIILMGQNKNALEQYRNLKTQLVQIDLDTKLNILIPKSEVIKCYEEIGTALNNCIEQLRLQYGENASNIVFNALNNIQTIVDTNESINNN